MRNSCNARAIKVMLKKYAFGEGCESGAERCGSSARKEYNAVEEGGLVRRCGAQAKDEEVESCWWCCWCSSRQY